MKRRRMTMASCVAFALAVAVVLLRVLDPETSSFFPKCLFHTLTGWHCPGCGTGRAAHALVRGDFTGAFRMNPLLIVALPFLAALAIRPSIGRRKAVPWIVLAVVLAYWILRNIPHHPFCLLAPR